LGYASFKAAGAIMNARVTALIVCLALAAVPALARQAKAHKPAAQAGQNAAPNATHKTVRKSAEKKPAEKKEAGKTAPAAIAKAYAAMPPDERLAIQTNLAWTGYYEGPPGGDFDDQRVIDAVKLFQKAAKDKETGILNDEERAHLAAAAEPAQRAVGWRLIDDPATGAHFGLPEKLVSPLGNSRTGRRWSSGHSQIEINDFHLSEASLPVLFEAEKKTPRGRRVESSTLKPESYVISGTQGLKNFVTRAESDGAVVRGITVLYDQATAGIMAPVAIAIANSFDGFPDANAALPPGQERAVEYSTAIVADQSGDLIAVRQDTADCTAITVPPSGHAIRIAEDKTNGLVLLRIYGARNLVPAALAAQSQGDDLMLVGIADPTAQHGGDVVTKAAAHLDGQNIEPAPNPGFSGAAVIDAGGHFAGMVELESSANAATGLITRQATLISAGAVRAFLAAHGIRPATGQTAVDRSVVRVICVRK
jgi:peptidoglycan hydrolase-like protein with peptidoglycan-binding domain